jgi:signal transduction histidine kinase
MSLSFFGSIEKLVIYLDVMNLCSALINDVLDLSKIEAGKMEFESVPYNIRLEIDEALSIFDEKVHQKGVDVLVLVHDAVPTCVVGDPGRLCQVRRRFLKGFVVV